MFYTDAERAILILKENTISKLKNIENFHNAQSSIIDSERQIQREIDLFSNLDEKTVFITRGKMEKKYDKLLHTNFTLKNNLVNVAKVGYFSNLGFAAKL